ncbi:MAG: Na/Pi cotransporter family protein [Gammaproteobacteria bacterium]|nr:Na/Pi cotransporter family protein [Gammaproteobacteria bacterium]MBQ0839611.1 Na/Pi cotransporter family protein [Gammaproteobacteria bacterium]
MFQFWQLLAGLGVFIYAMKILEQSLRALSTRHLRTLLRYHTRSPLQGVAVGTISTAFLQSSSLVGLFVLAFVGSGILPLQNALGIIFGANLGTTFTGWIVTAIGFKLDLNGYSLILIALGSLAYATFKAGSLRYHQAALLFGFGLLLLGLSWMKESMSFLGTQVDASLFQDYPLIIYFFGGVVFTALIQSSSATMVIILSAVNADIIPLSTAAAIAIGSDLGTTATLMLGSVKGSSNTRRVALSHFLFNVGTSGLALLLLTPLLAFITLTLGIKDTMYALVCFHSLFNLMGIALFLPFTKPFARWLEQCFTETGVLGCSHIKLVPATVPEAALRAIERDTDELINKALLLNLRILKSPPETLPSSKQALEIKQRLKKRALSFDEQYADIKTHEEQLQHYSHQLPDADLDDSERQILANLLEAARDASYSTKSLKDIRANLIDIRQQEGVAELLKQIDTDIITLYKAIFSLLETSEKDWADDAIVKINAAIAQSHDQLHQKMRAYSHTHNSEITLPTLFNINREIYVSNQNLLKAVQTIKPCQQALYKNGSGAQAFIKH